MASSLRLGRCLGTCLVQIQLLQAELSGLLSHYHHFWACLRSMLADMCRALLGALFLAGSCGSTVHHTHNGSKAP